MCRMKVTNKARMLVIVIGANVPIANGSLNLQSFDRESFNFARSDLVRTEYICNFVSIKWNKKNNIVLYS